MISKPFELNKERLRKDFNSPKYENRRKEFFATFSEFLRSYKRDKYYEFMNDIQTEVNFFAWFDHYFKPKLLAGRNTNTNNPTIQKEVIKNSLPSSKLPSTDNASLTRQDTKISNITPLNTPPLTLSHACDNTLAFSPTSPDNVSTRPFLTSLISQNNITPPNVQPLTKNHACSTSDNNLLSSVNIHLATNNQNNIATKQTLMVINNANQQDNKDLDKKTNANY